MSESKKDKNGPKIWIANDVWNHSNTLLVEKSVYDKQQAVIDDLLTTLYLLEQVTPRVSEDSEVIKMYVLGRCREAIAKAKRELGEN